MNRPPYTDSTLFHTPWPEGVIGRYVTVGGSTVDITQRRGYTPIAEPTYARATCIGCDAHQDEDFLPDYEGNGQPEIAYAKVTEADREAAAKCVGVWAQRHAETCRAMPKPNGSQQ